MSILEHIEAHLGKIDRGWVLSNQSTNVQVVRLLNEPVSGVATYCTVGLSDAALRLRGTKLVRQEFLFLAHERFDPESIASFLLTFSNFVKRSGKALLRGEVVGPTNPVVPGVEMNAIYAAIPVGVFDDKIATYSESEPPTVFVWLVPIRSSEADFVRSHGWSRFEDILERKNPNLWDLSRPSVVS